MPSKHLKTFFSFIFAVILTLGLSISFQSLLAAYTAPLVNPSGCTFGNPGCDAPINVGPTNQSKAGGLAIVGAFAVGDNSYFTGKVGIGIAVANYKLDVQGGQINSSNGYCIDTDCKTAWSQIGVQSETDPNVPAYAKSLNQYVNTNSNVTFNTVTASAFTYSDKNLKKNINLIPNALDKILKLEGVEFQWKKDNRPDLGLIAQDVEKVFPDLVHTNQTTKLKSLEYGNLVAPLIEAIKEQQKQIEELKQEIEKLK